MSLGSVVLLGDSITARVATSADWFTPGNSEAGNPLGLLRNAGVASNTTLDILARIDTDVLAWAPDYCTVLAGTNDLGTRTAAEIQGSLADIYDTLVAAGITPIVCTLTPRSDLDATTTQRLDDVNAWIRANYSAWPGALLVDWTAALSNSGASDDPVAAYFADAVHPNAAGAAVMADVLADALAAIA